MKQEMRTVKNNNELMVEAYHSCRSFPTIFMNMM